MLSRGLGVPFGGNTAISPDLFLAIFSFHFISFHLFHSFNTCFIPQKLPGQAIPEAGGAGLQSDARGLKGLEMCLLFQDELRLRVDFLLVTCFRGNDYLPQLMPLRAKWENDEKGDEKSGVTRCDVDSADLWPRYLTWRQKSSPGAGLDTWPSSLNMPWTEVELESQDDEQHPVPGPSLPFSCR